MPPSRKNVPAFSLLGEDSAYEFGLRIEMNKHCGLCSHAWLPNDNDIQLLGNWLNRKCIPGPHSAVCVDAGADC